MLRVSMRGLDSGHGTRSPYAQYSKSSAAAAVSTLRNASSSDRALSSPASRSSAQFPIAALIGSPCPDKPKFLA
ncbi:hypothetical protein DO72_5871 [Burkholderia pseudomallei]|nr:hypothetical protein DO72_5863 [Burkholderia pseudomallei]KGD34599.1 hypothetical protein DO72_5871 [Burkholderia pseudomallei]